MQPREEAAVGRAEGVVARFAKALPPRSQPSLLRHQKLRPAVRRVEPVLRGGRHHHRRLLLLFLLVRLFQRRAVRGRNGLHLARVHPVVRLFLHRRFRRRAVACLKRLRRVLRRPINCHKERPVGGSNGQAPDLPAHFKPSPEAAVRRQSRLRRTHVRQRPQVELPGRRRDGQTREETAVRVPKGVIRPVARPFPALGEAAPSCKGTLRRAPAARARAAAKRRRRAAQVVVRVLVVNVLEPTQPPRLGGAARGRPR
mmetsp:Transcript_19461/g.65753  ORF Transcript_19461/g.65753 Transcript_19461/m.65753 type:complete len:256 (-) Transcript_19461:14-781(-)